METRTSRAGKGGKVRVRAPLADLQLGSGRASARLPLLAAGQVPEKAVPWYPEVPPNEGLPCETERETGEMWGFALLFVLEAPSGSHHAACYQYLTLDRAPVKTQELGPRLASSSLEPPISVSFNH